MTPVAQHHLLDIADAESVDENEPRANLVSALHRLSVELGGLAIFKHENPILVDARLAGDLGVLVELAVLAMPGDELPGAHRVAHFPHPIPLCVTGYCNRAGTRIE